MNQNPYQAPNNQYAPQPQPEKKSAGLDALINVVIKILPILVIVFVGIGATSLLYNFIMGVVYSFDYYGGIETFFNGIATGIASLARYCFYAVVTAGIYKLAKK